MSDNRKTSTSFFRLISKAELESAVKESSTISQIFIKFGLAKSGSSFEILKERLLS